jgi:hypothetical protein
VSYRAMTSLQSKLFKMLVEFNSYDRSSENGNGELNDPEGCTRLALNAFQILAADSSSGIMADFVDAFEVFLFSKPITS